MIRLASLVCIEESALRGFELKALGGIGKSNGLEKTIGTIAGSERKYVNGRMRLM